MREQEKKRLEKPWETPGDYLQNAEAAVEGNYNMVGDGIINNVPPPGDDLTDGQTWEEMRNLAPGTLPEARQEKKPSVRECLQSATSKPSSPGKKPAAHDDLIR